MQHHSQAQHYDADEPELASETLQQPHSANAFHSRSSSHAMRAAAAGPGHRRPSDSSVGGSYGGMLARPSSALPRFQHSPSPVGSAPGHQDLFDQFLATMKHNSGGVGGAGAGRHVRKASGAGALRSPAAAAAGGHSLHSSEWSDDDGVASTKYSAAELVSRYRREAAVESAVHRRSHSKHSSVSGLASPIAAHPVGIFAAATDGSARVAL